MDLFARRRGLARFVHSASVGVGCRGVCAVGLQRGHCQRDAVRRWTGEAILPFPLLLSSSPCCVYVCVCVRLCLCLCLCLCSVLPATVTI